MTTIGVLLEYLLRNPNDGVQMKDLFPIIRYLRENPVGSSIVPIEIVTGDFVGNVYTNALLIGKVAGLNFDLYTFGVGISGVLLCETDAYQFNSATGAITADPQGYKLYIWS